VEDGTCLSTSSNSERTSAADAGLSDGDFAAGEVVLSAAEARLVGD